MKNTSLHLNISKLLCATTLTLSTLLFGNLCAQSPMISLQFENAPLGTVTNDTFDGWSVTGVDSNRIIAIETDSSNFFGNGTSGHMLDFSRLIDNAGSMSFKAVDAFTPTSLITLSFTLYDPTSTDTGILGIYIGKGTPGGTNLGGYIGLRNGSVTSSSGGTGTGTYTEDNRHRFDIIFNNASTSATYSEGTISSNSFDVWVDGSRILENAAYSVTGLSYDGNLSSVQFIYSSTPSGPQSMYFGEIGVFNGGVVGAPIPESSTTALCLAIAALALLGYRKGLFRRG